MTRIAVIDHGAGNLVSISQGLERSGATVTIAENPAQLGPVDGIVLPGVGSTGAAMRNLAAAGFVEPLRNLSKPLLGICVGLQLFFEYSDEDGTECLGLLEGPVKKLTGAPKLPHIGWNDIEVTIDPIFDGLPTDPTFYFVHTYAPQPDDASTVIAHADYGGVFPAAARRGGTVGVQFHPERSGPNGLRVLSNFVTECRVAADAA